MTMLFAIIALIILSTCDGFSMSYRNHALLHGTPLNTRELQFFKDMATLYNVTFWRKPSRVGGHVEFTISPYSYAELMLDTYRTKIRFRTIMEDVQIAFDRQTVKHYTKHETGSFDWENFYSLYDIYDWLKDLRNTYPRDVQLLPIGKTNENRDIFALKLRMMGPRNNPNIRQRPKVIIEGGCHGREWISSAVVTYMIHALLNAESSNSDKLKLIAFEYEWLFVPVMNPDGYIYSQTNDRLWKKNRRDGHGVDLNRNFGILFGKHDVVKNKNHDEYCGQDPFSEPESAAMAAFARENNFNLQYYLSFHSYGQYIILPYSFTKGYEDNYKYMKELADKMAAKLFTKYNINYLVGTHYDTQGYLASGVSADWVKRAINVTHVASISLPDTGVFGYALPNDRILPTCQATLDGLLEFFQYPKELKKEVTLVQYTEDSAQYNRALSGILFICYVIIGICN